MPAELRSKLVDAATRSGRSLKGELVHRLEEIWSPLPERAPVGFGVSVQCK
jgi:hypothetical protein